MSEYTVKIARLHLSTKNAIRLDLDIPDALKNTFRYVPGQHIIVSFKLERDRYQRAYSICSSPGELYLSICVKRQPGGIVSNYISNAMQVGDFLTISEPMGDFFDPAHVNGKTNVVLWAGGSGITPMRGIAHHLLENNRQTVVHLVYVNYNEKNTIFYDELRQWEAEFLGRFIAHFRFTERPLPWQAKLFGFWSEKRPEPDKDQQLAAHLKHLNIPVVGTIHYLCGPNGMMKGCGDWLVQMGVCEEDIYKESFGLPLFAEVGQSVATLTLYRKNSQTTHTVRGMTLLDALLAEKIDVPHACRIGSCGTCKAKLIEGEVSMMKAFALNNADRENNLILCCQAFARSETVSIEL